MNRNYSNHCFETLLNMSHGSHCHQYVEIIRNKLNIKPRLNGDAVLEKKVFFQRRYIKVLKMYKMVKKKNNTNKKNYFLRFQNI